MSGVNRGKIRPNRSLKYPLRRNGNERLDDSIVSVIVKELIYSSKSVLQISRENAVGVSTVERINTGVRHFDKEYDYPLRVPGTGMSYLKLSFIIRDIESNKRKFSEIEKNYNISKSTVNRINQGKIFRQENKKYPLRNSRQRVYNL